MNERDLSLLRLILASDIGNVRFLNLLEKFGVPENILKASKKDLISVAGIGQNIAESIINSKNSEFAESELKTAEKNNIKIVLFTDKNYPKSLVNFADKPLALYVKGEILEQDFDSFSIVGSRRVSAYGKTVTSEFASYFANQKITIVSGLARGVDTIAHVKALENNSRTIAVLGNGILINYPPENAKLQEKISENGAVISEFPLFTQPEKGTFPRRNRIVAGFSRATLVTEAAAASGALITARFCAEYGKEVFAVPGNIYSKTSQGTNELIAKGASVALSVQCLADQLEWVKKNEVSTVKNRNELLKLTAFEKRIIKLIETDEEGSCPEIISHKLNADISEVLSTLFNLEIQGLIKTTSTQTYIRNF